METKIEVRIKLDDGRELVMTEKDARVLYDQLNTVFGPKYPYTFPHYPVTWTSNNTGYQKNDGTIYCNAVLRSYEPPK